MDFDHAQIALRLMVVEGHGEILKEHDDFVFVGPESAEQAAYRALLAPSASPLAVGREYRWGLDMTPNRHSL